jgi:hypothetical protein
MELDLATPVSHPPSKGMFLRSHAAYPIPKNKFASVKKLQNLVKLLFCIKKSEKVFDKLTFGNSEFVNMKFGAFNGPMNSISMIYIVKVCGLKRAEFCAAIMTPLVALDPCTTISIMTLSKMTFSITTLSITTLSITTLSLTTLSISTLSIRTLNTLCRMSFMLSAIYAECHKKPIRLSVIMVNVVAPWDVHY